MIWFVFEHIFARPRYGLVNTEVGDCEVQELLSVVSWNCVTL